MDIAALLIGFSQMNLHQQASISVMKMAMDKSKAQTVNLIQILETGNLANTDARIMEQSVSPYVGENIDIRLSRSLLLFLKQVSLEIDKKNSIKHMIYKYKLVLCIA